jgi:cyclic pyranopterin phosphate synthase
MVDVGEKEVSQRSARAGAFVRMSPSTLDRLARGDTPKGDVFATVRIAGIGAAKRTADLIPLCHPLPLTRVAIDVSVETDGVRIESEVGCTGRTGVEMEALVAASVAALTLYDMLKSVERGMTIEAVKVLEKRGGRSGHYVDSGAAG